MCDLGLTLFKLFNFTIDLKSTAMGSIPMPFFATRAATLYTERIRAEKQRKSQQPEMKSSLDNGRNGWSYFRFTFEIVNATNN